MGKRDGRMYVLYMSDILPLVFVCQITPSLPSIRCGQEMIQNRIFMFPLY